MDSSYAPTADTHPRKALLFSLLLLAGTTGLAGAWAWHQRTIALGERIGPEAWRISFTPPGRWIRLPEGDTSDTLAFESPASARMRGLLVVRRIVNPSYTTPGRIAERYLRDLHYPGLKSLMAPPFHSYPARFGAFPGAAVADVANGTIVSAAMIDGEAYCIAIIVDHPLARTDLELARQVVQSVHYQQE